MLCQLLIRNTQFKGQSNCNEAVLKIKRSVCLCQVHCHQNFSGLVSLLVCSIVNCTTGDFYHQTLITYGRSKENHSLNIKLTSAIWKRACTTSWQCLVYPHSGQQSVRPAVVWSNCLTTNLICVWRLQCCIVRLSRQTLLNFGDN